MDIVAIVLICVKKWKAALICSVIGVFFMLFAIPFIPLWWISGIIYAITIMVSVVNLKSEEKKTAEPAKPVSAHVFIGDRETQLNKARSMYLKGLISDDEYEDIKRKILAAE
ncbi:Short C-terminal domain-containing protein [Acholeplasma oculi]|uniref:SHOCT domain-containing protein n=1 Tax=Acholeplasma oculi TaxID=35623 RepID=A0A061A9B0_9MOLU|nr:SHOCT domain-containing protein [Acholeplasma oculi]CDR30480.1 hypothetical protein, DUF2078 [Acholeplasma oculi]SKC48156.1 Short C-terminal domain-containing protein [Acholeplasma oculi]